MKREKIGTLRACCVSVIMFIIGASLYAQSTQRGLVLEYRGSETKTPLKNVSVSAANASATMSDDKGEFTLNFRTLHAGDAIQFRRVELNGYEVMNTEALETARVARTSYENQNQNENPSLNVKLSTLNIVMARRETLQKLRDGYRSIAVQRYEKQLKASEAEIERLKQEGKLAEEQYNERLNALEEEYEEKLSQLENYIDKFARIDLSNLDADEQQIIDLVQAGNFDEALALYDKQNLADRLRQSREDQQKLVAMRDQLAEAANKKAAESQRLRASIDRQVTLLYMAGGEENMLKAHRILKETFLADTTNVEARREYAFSLQRYQQFDEQTALLKSGISTEKDAFNKGMMILDLMDQSMNREEIDEALSYAINAESIMIPLQESNYNVLTRGLPAWSITMLRCYKEKKDMASCQKVMERVRSQWNPDTLSRRSILSYVYLLNDMSELYSQLQNHDQSLWCARESVRLGAILESRFPAFSNYHESCASAASTMMLLGKKSESLAYVRISADLMEKRLEKAGAISAYCDLLPQYYTLMDVLLPVGEFELADSIMQTARKNKLLEKVEGYPYDMARLYAPICKVYFSRILLHKGAVEEAEKLSAEAFSVLENYEYGVDVASYMRPDLEARIRMRQGRFEEALKSCQSAIDVCKATYEESQDAWDADNLCREYQLQTEIYLQSGNKKKAKESLKKAKKVSFFPYNQWDNDRFENELK